MRNIDQSFLRLLALAEHFEKDELHEQYYGLHFFYSDDKKRLLIGMNGKYHCIFPQAVCELVYLFSDFKKQSDGGIIYTPAPSAGMYFGMMEYFGLELNEFLHLFSVDGQNTDLYGGKKLGIDYTSEDLAKNI